MIKDFIFGFSAYFKAFNFVRKHNLWLYMLLPGILSLLVGTVVFGVIIYYFGSLVSVFQSWYPFDFGAGIVANLGAVLSSIISAVTGFFLYKYLVIIIASPFMSLLSEKVEYILNPNHTARPFSVGKMLKEFVRGLRVALRNLIRELGITLGLLLLGFFPVIGVLSVPLIFAVQAYYAGFGNMDFYYERFYNVRQTVTQMRSHRFVTVGNGAFFLLLLGIPILGLFLAPALGTVAGTLCCDKLHIDHDEDFMV